VVGEILLRAIVYPITEARLGTWWALSLSALPFGMLHVGTASATAVSTITVALQAGLLLPAAFVLTRQVWLPIGLPIGWDVEVSIPVCAERLCYIKSKKAIDYAYPPRLAKRHMPRPRADQCTTLNARGRRRSLSQQATYDTAGSQGQCRRAGVGDARARLLSERPHDACVVGLSKSSKNITSVALPSARVNSSCPLHAR
jgi:Type II CAAX prenyl endopeptidase Rce1-like